MKAAEIIARAGELVGGDRERTHGPKSANHDKIAALWNAYLGIRRDKGYPLTGADVAILMALLKIARTQLGAYNADDAVDLVGYGAVYGEIAAAVEAEVAKGREDAYAPPVRSEVRTPSWDEQQGRVFAPSDGDR